MNLQERADQLMALAKRDLALFAAGLEGFCEVTTQEAATAFTPEVVSAVTVDVGGSPVEVKVSHKKDKEAKAPEGFEDFRHVEPEAPLPVEVPELLEPVVEPEPVVIEIIEPVAEPVQNAVQMTEPKEELTADILRSLSKARGK